MISIIKIYLFILNCETSKIYNLNMQIYKFPCKCKTKNDKISMNDENWDNK